MLGILDSSFFFAPLGNDLLVVAHDGAKHSISQMLYYAGMSTIGSVLGCLLVDVIFRKAGEKGLEKHSLASAAGVCPQESGEERGDGRWRWLRLRRRRSRSLRL